MKSTYGYTLISLQGTPKGSLPDYFERQHNFKVVAGSKFAKAAVAAFPGDAATTAAATAAAATSTTSDFGSE